MAHIKSRSINSQTGEEVVTYFTDEEWATQEQARLDAEAAEAARDLKQEELDRMTAKEIAFYKLYAQDTGRTIPELKAAVKALM